MAVITRTVAQYLVDIGGGAYTAGDDVTIVDTGANIAGLSAAQIAALDDNNVDTIDASDDLITLDDDQAIALAASATAVDAGDFLILSDTGANLAGISASNYAAIAAKGFGIVTASDSSVSYTVAQYQAITNGGMAIDGANTVTLADTDANTAALSAAQIAALASNGVDTIDTSDNTLSLTVAQFQALGAVTLTAGDAVTIADTGANISTLTAGQIGTATVDTIDATSGVISWTKAKYDAGVSKITGESVTIEDTGANLAAINAAAIAALDAQVDAYDATDNAVSLSLAQLDALATATIALTAGDTVTAADSQANIEALSAGDFTTYITQGVDAFNSTDDVLNLTVAQTNAVAGGGATFVSADIVTVADTAANISALTSTQIANMSTALVDAIDSATDVITWDVAEATALGNVDIATNDTLTISDTGANIGGISAAQFTALDGKSAAAIVLNASDNAITFTVAQATALGATTVHSSDAITLADTGANIGGLTSGQITSLATLEAGAASLTINASDDAFTWDAAEAAALGSGIAVDASDTITVSDTGANIDDLTAGDLDDLDALAAAVVLDASDNAYTISAAQASAVDGISLASGDTVTVSDADIGAITSGDITTLAAQAASIIFDDSNNAYTLDEAQAAEVGDISLASGDAVLVSDASMGGLSSTQIANLAAKDATVTFNEVGGDDAYTIDAAEAAAIGDILLATGDTVTVADTGANLAALTTVQLANLAAKDAAVVLDSSTNTLSLTVAQVAEIQTGLTLTGADIVSILDTGANIAAMSAGTISGLAAKGIDIINASDDVLSLTIAQFQALGSVNLNNGDTVTISDTAANIQGLSAAQLAALASSGVDLVNATDNAITFTAEQAAAIGSVDFAASDTITVADTGANIGGLTASQITILDGLSAGVLINASDDAITFTAAQASAIGSVDVHSSDTVTISDTGAAIGGMSASDFTDLAALDATVLINASDNAVTLTAAKAAAVGDITWHATDTVTISDTGAAIAGLTAGQLTTLDGLAAAVVLDASDNTISFTAAQAAALGTITVAGTDAVTIADTGANINSLTATDVAELATIEAGASSLTIDASDNAISWTVAKATALGGIAVAGTDTLTISDTGANIATITTGNLSTFDGLAATVILDASDNAFTFTAAKAAALAGVGVAASDTVTVADTGANIGGLAAGEITVLAALSGTVLINASDNAFTWTAAKASELGDIDIHSSDTLTVADTGAAIGGMSASDFTDLAAVDGTVLFNASDDAVTLTAAKAAAVGDATWDASDTITIADTAANLAALTSTDIDELSDLAAAVVLDASDNTQSLTVAQYLALGDVTLAAGDTVTISDTGANIATLTSGQLGGLAAANVDAINASDNAVSWTVAQYNAGISLLDASDSVTLADTGANLAAINAAAIAALDSQVDVYNATDNVLSLNKAQLDALATATITLTAGDTVTFADTQANIEALSAGNITTYITQGVDVFDATDNALNLTAAQVNAVTLGATFVSADTVTLADTGANIAGMTATEIGRLGGDFVDSINASDNAITWTAAKAAALGDVNIHSSDTLTVSDTGANLATLSAADITDLGDADATVVLDASDNVISFTAAQATAIADGAVDLTAADAITIADTGANLAAISATDWATLDAEDVDTVDASDNVLNLTVAQYEAAFENTIALTSGDVVSLLDTGANLAALTTTQISGLDTDLIDVLNASNDVLTISKAQYDVLGSVGLTAGDVVTMTATTTQIAALTSTQIAAIAAANVDIIDVGANTIALTVAQFNALGALAFNAGATVTVTSLTTAGNDTVTGSGGADNIDGLAGNDSINGAGGDDSLLGGLGNDTLIGGAGENTINGGDGNDSITGGDEGDSLIGGTGNDTIIGGDSEDDISGGTGNDSITSGDDDDTVSGGDGNDTVAAGAGNDSINGGNGNDSITGAAGTDELFGDAGNDTIDGGADDDTISGGTGNDSLLGDANDDSIDGGDGNDTINGGADADTLNGGIGNDSILGGIGGDQLNGDAGADRLFGDAGSDTLDGGADADRLFGGDGTDTLTGGAGNDFIYGDDDVLTVDGGGEGADSITGGDGADQIFGGAGDDDINGNAGADIIQGGSGSDTISGGTENDRIYGDDTILSADAAGEAADEISGGDGNDIIYAGGGDDSVDGDAGIDLIHGGSGGDTINGGDGADRLYGDDAILSVDAAGEGADEINGGDGNDFIYGGAGADSLNGDDDNDFIFGGTGGDIITGGNGVDQLRGEAGNDIIHGDAGSDLIYGGAGDDVFVFDTAIGVDIDRLVDFSQSGTNGNDSIHLDNDIFTALGAAGALAAGNFVNGTAAADANDFIIYQQSTGKLWYDADGNGAGAAVQIALISTRPVLTAADFTIIE